MEKITKKKKSKRLRRRIGLIAIGGLSLVLTICLSVGATLAWFAGSTWASNDLYMGGPVYVEMAGRGQSSGTAGGGTFGEAGDLAEWQGGDGKLDIVASAREHGTVDGQNDKSNILLPGQKLLIYSQARVYSTEYEDNLASGAYKNQSSGANTGNISSGTATYTDGRGRVKSTTTSVLRAKFSINVEFDPTVGFNGFTDPSYANGYPTQSTAYNPVGGLNGTATYTLPEDAPQGSVAPTNAWEDALYNPDDEIESLVEFETVIKAKDTAGKLEDEEGYDSTKFKEYVKTFTGRRDAVSASDATQGLIWVKGDEVNSTFKSTENDTKDKYVINGTLYGNGTGTGADNIYTGNNGGDTGTSAVLEAIQKGAVKSIRKWKYVSKSEYFKDANAPYRMGAPFNGTVNSAGTASNTNAAGENNASGTGNGYYGLWEATGAEGSVVYTESDAFYKARTNAYIQSYVEHYRDETDRNLILTIGSQITALEDALNNAFVGLVNESSDNILSGNVNGFTANNLGQVVPVGTATPIGATWLYVDSKIGRDTNAADSASSVGGWWYLVKSADIDSVTEGVQHGTLSGKTNKVATVVDNISTSLTENKPGVAYDATTGVPTYTWNNTDTTAKNTPTAGASFTRSSTSTAGTTVTSGSESYSSDDTRILNAELYEVSPTATTFTPETIGTNSPQTKKVVSVAFPFVNGNFELPSKELTNIFANAKISFQITFQALQAFFPFTPSIDGLKSGSALAGTEKALNINNAIPIYNEAFDYLSFLSR